MAALSFSQTTAPADPISTIRPRQTDSTKIVPVGKFQLELGAEFDFGSFPNDRSNNYGQAVVRYGINSRLEARILLPTYSTFDDDLSFQEGFGNASVAASYFLGRLGKSSWAVQPQLQIPSAVEARRPEEVSPSLFLTGEATLGRDWTLDSTVGWTHVEYDFGGVFQPHIDFYRATLCAERNFSGEWSAFTEYVGDYSHFGAPYHRSNTGARYRLSARSQVDLHVTIPIGNVQSNSFGVGYAVRF